MVIFLYNYEFLFGYNIQCSNKTIEYMEKEPFVVIFLCNQYIFICCFAKRVCLWIPAVVL